MRNLKPTCERLHCHILGPFLCYISPQMFTLSHVLIMEFQVVFFGDNVPKARAEEALGMVKSSDAVLVVGSSLMVMSAFRLIR